MANPAQVQSVNYSYDIPQDNPFLTMLQAGVEGYYKRRDEGKNQFATAFPVLAQMKMIKPVAKGTQGAYSFAGSHWLPTEPGTDWSQLNSMYGAMKNKYDLEHPNKMAAGTAMQAAQMSNEFWNIAKKDPKYAVKLIKDIQTEYEKPESVLPETPLAAKRIFAKKGKQRIYSEDFGNTWFEEGTDKEVK